MKNIDKAIDLQSMLAELKQLEQDLFQTAQHELPALNNHAYFKQLFAEINTNNEAIEQLLEENRQIEEEYILAKQEEVELEQEKSQLYNQSSHGDNGFLWKDKSK